MIITKIQKEDLTNLSALYEELSGTKSNPHKLESTYEQMLQNGCYHLLGAKINHQLAGSLMGIQCFDLVDECRPFMVIENVIVSKDFRKKGIGKALFCEIEQIAKSLDCYYLFFVSSETRKEAHAFYETLGYTRDKVKGFKKFL